MQHGYQPSRNEYDWLGDGIYFWQDAPHRALEWAEEQHGNQAAVLVSHIELVNCLDFLDVIAPRLLSAAYGNFVMDFQQTEQPLPEQKGKAHRLDCAVINHAVAFWNKQENAIQSIRSAFREGFRVYEQSALFSHSHVQIAVLDSSVILETKKWEG